MFVEAPIHPLLLDLPPAAAPRAKSKPKPYTVIRDTREKLDKGWVFEPSKKCGGTVSKALPTGDYTIEGYENRIIIDRKGSISEFATNIYEARFLAELNRMRSFKFAHIILEFSCDDIMNWPASSSIPRSRWPKLKLTPFSFLRRVVELQILYPHVHFTFAGSQGKALAASLFLRLTEAESPDSGPV